MAAERPSPPRDLSLSTLLADAEEVSRATHALCTGLTEDQLLYRPDLESWSIAHCFDHLRITNDLYFWRLRPAIERARARGLGARPAGRGIDGAPSIDRSPARKPSRLGGGEPLRLSWLGRLFFRELHPETTRRHRAQKLFRPDDKPPAASWRHFLAGQATLLALLREAGELPLNRIKVSSPVMPLLRFTLGDALAVLVVHEQRHLRQAQRVRADEYFPTW
jgi:hypothetical protein